MTTITRITIDIEDNIYPICQKNRSHISIIKTPEGYRCDGCGEIIGNDHDLAKFLNKLVIEKKWY
jgi:hypothetical protein